MDDARFAAIVTAGFGQRRKTLGNTLKPFLAAEAIAALGIDPKRRAETLSVVCKRYQNRSTPEKLACGV